MSKEIIYPDSLESFSQLLSEHQAILVDFYADWCGPCQGLSPILDAIADTKKDVKIIKVDVDALPSVAAKYSVRGIPLMLFIKDGAIEATLNGLQPRTVIEEVMENTIL